jgi:hypothetical protein
MYEDIYSVLHHFTEINDKGRIKFPLTANPCYLLMQCYVGSTSPS